MCAIIGRILMKFSGPVKLANLHIKKGMPQGVKFNLYNAPKGL